MITIAMNTHDAVLISVREYVLSFFKEKSPPQLVFHNYDNTLNVVKAARLIGEHEQLTQEDLLVVELAAWFIYTGYCTFFENHRDYSGRIARNFLEQTELGDPLIEKVLECIQATQSDKTPTNRLEAAIKDADTFYLSSNEYFISLNKLRKESHGIQKKYSDQEWYKLQLTTLIEHDYHTNYGETILEPLKIKNAALLKKKIIRLTELIDDALINEMQISREELNRLKNKLLSAKDKPDKEIEIMFNLTSKNHLSQRAIADTKASILVLINVLIIVALVVVLVQLAPHNTYLTAPSIIFLVASISSTIVALLALRPHLTKGTFMKEDIKRQNINLLFFGNFHAMQLEDYRWGMIRLMNSTKFLYSNFIDEVFYTGKVLAIKDRLLRYSYDVLLYGIVVSLLLFTASLLYENFI
ncbi:MAG: Pycsar system effector family protein [Bacteroidota bacterium]